MTSLAFDTLKAVKALRDAGFEETQAEAVVATVGEALGGSVATKTDIADTRSDLEKAIADLRHDLEKVGARLRADMATEFKNLYRHLRIMAAGIVGLTVALVKLIP